MAELSSHGIDPVGILDENPTDAITLSNVIPNKKEVTGDDIKKFVEKIKKD